MDYVGNQRSPLWDDMEAMEDESAKIGQDMPALEQEIKALQSQMTEACRKTRMITCYKLTDPETTVSISTNSIKSAKKAGRAPLSLSAVTL